MIEPYEDEPGEPLLTGSQVVELQRAIEAGLLAQDARLSGSGFGDATDHELRLLKPVASRPGNDSSAPTLGWSG